MNQRHLNYFVEVYKTQSIKKASEILMVSPQDVSKIIINLENELGGKDFLFIRSGNRLIPTEAADILLPQANQILDGFAQIMAHSPRNRILTVYSIDGIIGLFSMDFLKKFYEKHHDIKLRIIEVTNKMAINSLKQEDCELALLQKPLELPGFEMIPILRYTFGLLINDQHPLAKKKRIEEADWDGLVLAGRGYDFNIYRNYMNYLNKKGIFPHTILESNNQELVISMAVQNLAAAVISRKAIENRNIPHTVFFDNDPVRTENHVCLTYDRSKQLSYEAKCFKKHLIEWSEQHHLNG
jgi:LysR family cyn operon transcriptional activator